MLAAYTLSKLKNIGPFGGSEGALALRQEQLIMRSETENVNRLSMINIDSAWIDDNVLALLFWNSKKGRRANTLQRDGSAEESQDGRVKKCRNDREILQRALAYRYHQSFDIEAYQLCLDQFCVDVGILRCLRYLKSDLDHTPRVVSHRDKLPDRCLHD